MKTLQEHIADPNIRKAVIRDCVVVLEEEVNKKGGLGGLVVKGGFKVIKSLGSGTIERLIDWLLDEFVDAVEPFYQQFQQIDEPVRPTFTRFIEDRTDAVANALIGVTDQRRQRAKNKILISAYDKLRPQALQHVREGVPSVGRLLQKYILQPA